MKSGSEILPVITISFEPVILNFTPLGMMSSLNAYSTRSLYLPARLIAVSAILVISKSPDLFVNVLSFEDTVEFQPETVWSAGI